MLKNPRRQKMRQEKVQKVKAMIQEKAQTQNFKLIMYMLGYKIIALLLVYLLAHYVFHLTD